jgi:CheY-like chemotaxis protein
MVVHRLRARAALIVESDAALAIQLHSLMIRRATIVHLASSSAQAQQLLRTTRVDAALVDAGGYGAEDLELLELLWSQPVMPQVVVVASSLSPDVAFRIAQLGVRAFASKPLDLERLDGLWEQTQSPPDLRPLLRASVGRIGLRSMVDLVRQSMTEEAVAIAGGSRRRASGLLGISRQLLQHHILHQDCPPYASSQSDGRERQDG